MQALVLERIGSLALREIDLPLDVGETDVRIKIDTVGICGSDVHYYTHGRIGTFEVRAPMVLGHEASGTIVEVGRGVRNLQPGDRVCMEPGVPNLQSKASRMGLYNLDPDVTFWATPPVHGCLVPYVVHPASFVYKLPDNVSLAEGALVEPLAVGLSAAEKARIKPGDTALVIGAGPIGILSSVSALAGGCARVVISDLFDEKLAVASQFAGIVPVNIRHRNLVEVIGELTEGWGVDVVFEASGSPKAYEGIRDVVRLGGCIVAVGAPLEPVSLDIAAFSAKEIEIRTLFRYTNNFERAIDIIAAGRFDFKSLITETFPFAKGVEAFERAAAGRPGDIKLQISMR
ncbi:NAD(P)-dependent alcohol dehydrogenase [Shinella zoogloeoides]|uniref:NAD(P)-dependent alcohol dehydrogenase n=1 Tax=Shinella zoogloeoides TaxID=352475 RepID=UPI0028ABFDAC|nr:NAD(P)-dependent alcohol dehydrogenase [Shinella zoogloeoides]